MKLFGTVFFDFYLVHFHPQRTESRTWQGIVNIRHVLIQHVRRSIASVEVDAPCNHRWDTFKYLPTSVMYSPNYQI
jgi:hypothetical protein